MAVDIFDVHLHLTLKGHIGTAAHLPDARQTRANAQTAAMGQGVVLHFARQGRTRTNQGHLSTQHTPQLRKLIQTEPPDESPDPSYPRVPLDFERDAISMVIAIDQSFDQAVGAHHHRTKFWKVKQLSPHAHPFLPEEHGTAIGQLDGCGNEKQQRTRENEQSYGEGEVQTALRHPVRALAGCVKGPFPPAARPAPIACGRFGNAPVMARPFVYLLGWRITKSDLNSRSSGKVHCGLSSNVSL